MLDVLNLWSCTGLPNLMVQEHQSFRKEKRNPVRLTRLTHQLTCALMDSCCPHLRTCRGQLTQPLWLGLPGWMLPSSVFPAKCQIPSLEISFGCLLLRKGSKTSVAVPIDSIVAFSSFPQNAPFACFVSKNWRKVGLSKWTFCEILTLM